MGEWAERTSIELSNPACWLKEDGRDAQVYYILPWSLAGKAERRGLPNYCGHRIAEKARSR
jgi:hypothetical protein